jgi:hypothetical protein
MTQLAYFVELKFFEAMPITFKQLDGVQSVELLRRDFRE